MNDESTYNHVLILVFIFVDFEYQKREKENFMNLSDKWSNDTYKPYSKHIQIKEGAKRREENIRMMGNQLLWFYGRHMHLDLFPSAVNSNETFIHIFLSSFFISLSHSLAK